MPFTVVLLMASSCDHYDGKSCVQAAVGSFEHHSEAMEAAGKFPDWTAPHVVPLLDPSEFAGPAR